MTPEQLAKAAAAAISGDTGTQDAIESATGKYAEPVNPTAPGVAFPEKQFPMAPSVNPFGIKGAK